MRPRLTKPPKAPPRLPNKSLPGAIAPRLLAWFDQHGRHDLPWQHPRDAYRVWVSEIMLQQTQVATVIPYFERFIDRFPDIEALASATQDEVLTYWAGLGYYLRARNLHRAARIIASEYGGKFPDDVESVSALPGIGPSTAGAILAQAFGQRHAILDGNVKRVLSRLHAVEGWAGQSKVATELWALAEMHTPYERLADYSQAIMDLGATLCTRGKPRCGDCPLKLDCQAHLQRRTAELPSPRPKRERPQRQTRMLVIHNTEGAVLLYKRPPAGIWGGLWCLPELPEDAEVVRYCLEQFSLEVGEPKEAQPIRHGFTHFELTIQPLVVAASHSAPRVSEPSAEQWYLPATARQAPALPAPLSKLLHGKMLGSMISESIS